MQLPALASGVNKGTLTKITAFVELINNLSAMAKEMDVFALAKELLTVTGVSQDIYGDNSVEGKARQENVNELMNSISAFVDNKENEQDASLENYMQEVSLISDLDSDMEDNDGQRVMLMTVHGAKGLEFDHVFVAGLDETIFPSLMAETKREMEEERRLLVISTPDSWSKYRLPDNRRIRRSLILHPHDGLSTTPSGTMLLNPGDRTTDLLEGGADCKTEIVWLISSGQTQNRK